MQSIWEWKCYSSSLLSICILEIHFWQQFIIKQNSLWRKFWFTSHNRKYFQYFAIQLKTLQITYKGKNIQRFLVPHDEEKKTLMFVIFLVCHCYDSSKTFLPSEMVFFCSFSSKTIEWWQATDRASFFFQCCYSYPLTIFCLYFIVCEKCRRNTKKKSFDFVRMAKS